ncbi:hypothetical protein EDB83DRAFT_2521205 [Lactarius deliciosus]|nr:hypothetical protein EDB83DRAFT_2521205 [Lactarius deliciosus]
MIVVKPQSLITEYITCFSGIPAATLDPVTMTLSDVQTRIFTRWASTSQAGTDMAYTRVARDHGCGGHNPEDDSCACIYLLKAEIKNRPRFGGFWADYEPIMARIAQSRVKWARTVIVYPGSPGAWDGTSATAPAMTVACANNAEVLDRVLGTPSRHELIFG